MHVPASGEGSLARINLMYVGPLDDDHGAHALAEAFLNAHAHDPRLHLLVAGQGPASDRLKMLLGSRATFISFGGPAVVDELAAEADLLICPTTLADTSETIAAAQRSGLPVLAVDGGAAAALIENGRSGFLVPGDPATFADAIRWLSRRSTLRERLAVGGLVAAETRSRSKPVLNTGHTSESGLNAGQTSEARPNLRHTSEARRIMT
jgi:glycosyltransferase involved in cell wall biosynthesis